MQISILLIFEYLLTIKFFNDAHDYIRLNKAVFTKGEGYKMKL